MPAPVDVARDSVHVRCALPQAVAVMVGGVSAERAAEVFGLLLRVTRTIQLSSVRE